MLQVIKESSIHLDIFFSYITSYVICNICETHHVITAIFNWSAGYGERPYFRSFDLGTLPLDDLNQVKIKVIVKNIIKFNFVQDSVKYSGVYSRE